MRGLIRTMTSPGFSPTLRSTTAICLATPTWFAASPTPGAQPVTRGSVAAVPAVVPMVIVLGRLGGSRRSGRTRTRTVLRARPLHPLPVRCRWSDAGRLAARRLDTLGLGTLGLDALRFRAAAIAIAADAVEQPFDFLVGARPGPAGIGLTAVAPWRLPRPRRRRRFAPRADLVLGGAATPIGRLRPWTRRRRLPGLTHLVRLGGAPGGPSARARPGGRRARVLARPHRPVRGLPWLLPGPSLLPRIILAPRPRRLLRPVPASHVGLLP